MPSGKRLIDKITDELRLARHDWRERQGRELDLGSRELPSHQAVHQTVDTLCAILFPMRLGPPDLTKEREDQFVAYMLGNVERELVYQVALELQYLDRGQQALVALREQASGQVGKLLVQLAALRRQLDEDVLAAYHGDPAATFVDEVLISYPGVEAIIHHRIYHVFYR